GVLVLRPWQRPAGQAPEAPPQPRDEQVAMADEGPFPVAEAHEVDIISMDAQDADAVVMGPPLMGEFQLAAPSDIEVIEVHPEGEEGSLRRLEPGPFPMVVSSAGVAPPR